MSTMGIYAMSPLFKTIEDLEMGALFDTIIGQIATI